MKRYCLISLFLLGFTFAQDALKLRFYTNWFAEAAHGGFYAAVKDNLYAERGLDVELIQGGPGVNSLSLLASGKAEIVMLAGGQVVLARAESIPIVAIFATYQTSPLGLMFHAEEPINDFSELVGRSITVFPGATFWSFIEHKYNLKGKVKIINYNGQLAQWLNDRQLVTQSYVTAEPFLAKQEGAHPQSLLVADSGFNPYSGVLVTTEEFLNDHTEVINKFIDATREGWEHFLLSPLNYVDSLKADNDAITTKIILWSNEKQLPLILNQDTMVNGIGSMKVERWQELISQLEEVKMIKENIVSGGDILPISD